MGITGLLPLLEKSNVSTSGHISQFSGGTVAVDTYCWLHKGSFNCAEKIIMGQPTDGYVKYCMKFVHMLLAQRIKPILVFDGRHLPAKKETEVKRRENRETCRRQAAEMIKMGRTAEGKNLLRRCVDVTHEMALEVIKECQAENVDCIVAPYEADAQMAFLNISGIADVVITEDSDLTLFGCTKIFFKMDLSGYGVLVEQDRLHLAMDLKPEHFDIDKFRHMCILSGCDYLASLPGIGLLKARKFVTKNTEDNIEKALPRMGSFLNKKGLVVSKEYCESFVRALITFKHQLVYCPRLRRQVRLNPAPPEVTAEQLRHAGDEVSEELAWQLALGNCDPFTMKKLHDFDPDKPQKRKKTNSWHEKPGAGYVSIWSKEFKVSEEKENGDTSEVTKWPDTTGRVMVLNTNSLKEKVTPKKRNFKELAEDLSVDDVLEMYGSKKVQKNESTQNGRSTPPPQQPPSSPRDEESTSPILSRRKNPFAKPAGPTEISPSIDLRGKRRIKLRGFVGFRQTVIDDKVVQRSKYFNSECEKDDSETGFEGEERPSKKMEEISRNSPTILNTEQKGISEIEEEQCESEMSRRRSLKTDSEDDRTSSSSGIGLSQGSLQRESSPEARTEDLDLSMEVEACTRRSYDERELDELLVDKCELNSRGSTTTELPQRESDGDDADYTVNEESISSIRSSLFQWKNPKLTGNKSTTTAKSNPPKQRTTATAKTKTARKVGGKKAPPVEGQQSLLNMFGFQKKSILKH